MTSSILDLLGDDMTLGSEALPHGYTFGWGAKPRVNIGNNPAAYGYSKILAWGIVYEANTGNTATNTRVEVKDLELWVLSKSTGQWTLVQNTPTNVGGALFKEDQSSKGYLSPGARVETDGGTSAAMVDGYNYHFWTDITGSKTSVMTINPNDIAGVVASYQARLVVDDPTKADDRASARYVASAGTDYYNATSTSNNDAGIGRFKLLTNDYQLMTMSTLSEAQLALNPPTAFINQFASFATGGTTTNTASAAALAAAGTITTPAAPTTQTATAAATAAPASPASAVFRFYDQATGDHFYTTDAQEKAVIQAGTTKLVYEGAPWASPAKGADTVDVYRFFDTVTQTHFFTSDANERNSILASLPSFTYEGVAFEAYARPGGGDTITLERFYDTATQLHHFALPGEAATIRNGSAGANWVDEGAAFTVHAPL